MSTFKITFASGAQIVTGSNFLVEFGGKKVLIDCGLIQGERYSSEMNHKDFLYDPKEIDTLFVTHGHLDHVGRIPKLVRDGFKGHIVSTAPTREIAELVMLDSVGILAQEAKHHNLEELYDQHDVLKSAVLWDTVLNYEEEFKFKTNDGDAIIKFHDSGHILGSAIIEIFYKGIRIAFTGDLGNSPSPLLRDTVPLKDIDYLFMESVYGDRNHKDRDKRVEILKDATIRTIERGGTVLIPAFSIERTQEMLQVFDELVENKEISNIPIYLDSPLGINITKVYKKYESWLNDDVRAKLKVGNDIFEFKGLTQTPSPEESKEINKDNKPKVIIAGSGMSNGGRILYHEMKYLPDSKSSVVVVGYQAINTLGRRLVDKEKEVFIHGNPVEVKAELINIHGFSAHKDSDHLVQFVDSTKDTLKKIFVILGEPKSCMYLGQKLHETYDLPVEVPEQGEVIEI